MSTIDRVKPEPSIMANLDPRLLNHSFRQNERDEVPVVHSTRKNEVPILAKVNDLDRWRMLTEIKRGAEIKINDKEWVVTGRMPINRAQYIQNQDYVLCLSAGQRVFKTLTQTNRNIGLTSEDVTQKVISQELLDHAGEGTVVGVVDNGLDFVHNSFRNKDGTTRITHLWDQDGPTDEGSPFNYGKEHTAGEIDKALKTQHPYDTLGYKSLIDDNEKLVERAHGTHVMDIAAGSGKVKGIAHKAELIFVELAQKTSADIVDPNLYASTILIEAVKYIFEKAGTKPCVVNLSLGGIIGPHDGTSLEELAIDGLVSNSLNKAVIIAAGNSYNDEAHTTGWVKDKEITDIQMSIPEGKTFLNEIEIWYSGDEEFGCELIDPKGACVADVPLGKSTLTLVSENGTIKQDGTIYHRKHDYRNRDNVINLTFNSKFYKEGSTWKVRLRGINVRTGKFHAWLESRSEANPSRFIDSDVNYTLSALATGKKSIVVGSYDANRKDKISFFSSSGPTRDERKKPEVSAPGHDVWAANSTTKTRTFEWSGTSMSAPAVAGLVSRTLGEASKRKISLTIDETRQILTDTAQKLKEADPFGWHARYGYGRVRSRALTHSKLQLRRSRKLVRVSRSSILPLILLGITCISMKGYNNKQGRKRRLRNCSSWII
ncbi:MAG: Serine protease AprX [Chlamydiae bacterium]|nr:Serine protease AprX [Chlamydiota bacterium]